MQQIIKNNCIQLQMDPRVEQDLYRMLETITINAHYPCQINNLSLIFEPDFYFDICQKIFPELNIRLLKIKQSEQLNSGQKIQKLIDLLSQQLQIDLSSIKGAEVIRRNIGNVHRFLQVLEKFSQFHEGSEDQGDQEDSRRVKSDPNTSQRIQQKVMQPRSARQKIKKLMDDQYEDHKQNQQVQIKNGKNRKKKNPCYSAAKKQKRNRSETCKNVYSSLVNIMMNQKNRTMKASLRDNRKVKNQEIIEAKDKYKSYLLNYAKQSKAEKNRQNLKKSNSQQKVRQLPLSDFDQIQNFYKSFQYKLRDKKYCYLKRIQKLIRTQEVDRMCYLNRIQQQKNKQIKKSTKKQMDRLQNEHQLRSKVLKEQFESEKEANQLMKRQYERYLRVQKKQLKENKKKELDKIKDFMKQQNGKVLINFDQGGKLQQLILNMYKRF